MLEGLCDLWVRRSMDDQNTRASPPETAWHPTHRHRNGGLYRVVGQGVIEADRTPATIYDDAEGTVWIRPTSEFEDGRFEKLP